MPDTLLHYDLTTNPFPLNASPSGGPAIKATLTLIATNPKPQNPVDLQGITVEIPVGTDAADVTNDGASVVPVAPAGWQHNASGSMPKSGLYSFAPISPPAHIGGEGLVFTFEDVAINSTPGTANVVVLEGSGNCQPPNCPTASLPVSKFPVGWGTVTFWADPVIVSQGGSSTLHWAGPQGATYQIEYVSQGAPVVVPQQGQPPLANQGSYQVLDIEATTVFTLDVQQNINGVLYRSQQQLVVSVLSTGPTITSFTGSIETKNGKVVAVLHWTTQNTQYCTLSTAPEVTLTPNSSTGGYTTNIAPAYALTAYGKNNMQATSTLTLTWMNVNQVKTSARRPTPRTCKSDRGTAAASPTTRTPAWPAHL